ncbi:hypothetical protein ACOSQ2_020473 [Xanthoceras sorbifolium]
MSQLSESGGVQTNVTINGLPSSLGGSAHQPQLSEAQISAEKFLTGDQRLNYYRLNYYQPLFNAAQRGNWKSAKSFIDRDPNALTARITAVSSRTVFHVAALSCQWGLVLKLLELIVSPESLAVQDVLGNTVLHYVAQGGSLHTAKALVKKNSDLLQIVNKRGDLPLFFSIFSDSKELMWYLTLKTRVESSSFPKMLRNLIGSGCHDIALYFVQRDPELALAKDEFGNSLLSWLTEGRSFYFSVSNLGFLKRWIYKYLLESMEGFPASVTSIQPTSFATQVLRRFKKLLWKTIARLAPSIKMVRDEKLKHECAVELVNHVCTQLSNMSFQQTLHFLQHPPMLSGAVAVGIEEIVRILLQHFPDLIGYDTIPQRNIFQIAVECRQEKIVNILKEMFPTVTRNMCAQLVEFENTTLHLVGKLAPAFKQYSVSGAALQLQCELQWFKEVEKITFPYQREFINMNQETAKVVFRRQHKELADQGEKWMKGTANSCMLVSTLIATVLFAAAFTVPGGNVNDKGIPIFLHTNAFMVFAISEALGLFSSLTSLLMFLAILTARYAIEDFLESLPKKLIIGLGSLFFAIAAMIISFGATLTIVLSKRWEWVVVPITLIAFFPVALFVMLQLPLFVQMVQSTYGSSMFHPSPSRH